MPPTPQVAVGAVIRDDEGRLLVVQRGHAPAEGRWTLPGGRLEPGERLEDALRREVSEETGLAVEVGELVGHLEVVGGDHHFVILDFLARRRAGDTSSPRPGSDVTDVAWMTRGDLEEADTTDGLLDFLDQHGVDLAP
ncbi:MAG: NUDIX domain-containing protein [Nitriliruptorales bacterium]|nr:NUDIX domain-containing protein [Nitriliruptorales bacterium]